MPLKWPRAPSGVGKARRAAWSNVPSASSSRHPQIPTRGLTVHQVGQRVECACRHARVGVERQEVRRAGSLQREVRRGGEAEVPAGLDQLDAASGSHELDRSVARVVVDDDDPDRARGSGVGEGVQAVTQEVAAPVRDDPDVDAVRHRHALTGRHSWIETQRRIGNSSYGAPARQRSCPSAERK